MTGRPARFEFRELTDVLREAGSAEAAGLVLGLSDDHKRARDAFSTHFRRASRRELGEAMTPVEWLREHSQEYQAEQDRRLLRRGLELSEKTTRAWSRACAAARKAGATTDEEVVQKIAALCVIGLRRDNTRG